MYEEVGFDSQDSGLFGWVTSNVQTAKAPLPSRVSWPEPGTMRGLPPFAIRGQRWSSAHATVVSIDDPAGTILCEWTGDDADVATLLSQVMPCRWRMHTLDDDSLPRKLAANGLTIDLVPSKLQMIKKLREKNGGAEHYRLRVLDRI